MNSILRDITIHELNFTRPRHNNTLAQFLQDRDITIHELIFTRHNNAWAQFYKTKI